VFYNAIEVKSIAQKVCILALGCKIMPFEGDYSTADILCISDFGWMPISEEVMEKINAEKQKGMTFYGLNIVDSSTVGQYMRDHMEEIGEFLGSPTNVCDSMWEYENGICKETKKIENKQSD